MVLNHRKVTLLGEENILEIDSLKVAQHCEYNSCHGTENLKMVEMPNFMLCIFYNKMKKREKRGKS